MAKRKRASTKGETAASPPADGPTAFRTLDEVAVDLGLSRRTVMEWRARGMPWKEGGLPREEVLAWVALHKSKSLKNESQDPRAAKLARRRARAEAHLAVAKAKREALRLAREEGRYADLETLLMVCERSIHEARTYLGQLPDELVAKLSPAKLTAKAKTLVREISVATVRRAEGAIVAALEEWAAELEAQKDADGEGRTRTDGAATGLPAGGAEGAAPRRAKAGRGVAAKGASPRRRVGRKKRVPRAESGG